MSRSSSTYTLLMEMLRKIAFFSSFIFWCDLGFTKQTIEYCKCYKIFKEFIMHDLFWKNKLCKVSLDGHEDKKQQTLR